jgi:tetratricopeptide (TPR) repeat protein
MNKLLFAGGGALALIITAAVVFVLAGRNPEAVRDNTLRLAGEYIGQGEYQRALDLLDGLLIANPNDEEARGLRDEAIRARQGLAGTRTDGVPEGTEAAGPEDAGPAADNRDEEAENQEASEASADAEALAAAAAAAARRQAEAEELAKASAALQAQMKEVNALVEEGKAALRQNDFKAAEESFSGALSKLPRGETRFEAQKYAEISDAWYDGFARNNGNALGETAAKNAVSSAQESIRKDPALALPQYTLGRINRDRGNWLGAEAAFGEAVKLDPNNYLYAFELGRSSFRTGKYNNARIAFESAVKLNSGFEPAWYNLGGTYAVLKRNDNALAAYRRAVAIKSDYAVAYREIGRILSAKQDYSGAIDAFNEAITYNPGDIASLRDLGYAQNQAGQNQAAETSFTQALASDPEDPRTNDNMAIVKIDLKKYAEAVQYAKKAVAAEPAVVRYSYTLGLACEKAGDLDAAIGAYKNAARDPSYVRPRINLGLLYLDNGFPNEALSYLMEAYRAEPNSFEVNNNLGNVHARMENWDAAVERYKAALSRQSANVTVRMNLARAYVKSGNLPLAKEAYLEVLKLAPANYDALFELGKACASMGDATAAKQYLASLLEKSPSYSGRAEVEKLLTEL